MNRRVDDMVTLSASLPDVRPAEPVAPRELLERARPLFISAVQLAAERLSQADAACLRESCERMGRAPTPEARAGAYRDFLAAIAEASGSRFHRAVIAALVAEFGSLVDRGVRHDMEREGRWEDGDVHRLWLALDSRNPHLASQAAEDHMLVVGQVLDRIAATAG